jgi:lipoprotein-releasing system ATP-binding protein
MRIVGRGLGHAFAGRELYGDVGFELQAGDIAAILGPSGSGKSTLLSVLAGWAEPTAGTLVREGIDDVSWVPQNPFGVTQRTVLDHAVLPLLARGQRRKDAERTSRKVLERFGLGGVLSSRFGELSGGEGQRLMLARASICAAGLLVVDEPTAQLDPVSSGTVVDILGELADSGQIVVIATHDARVSAVACNVIQLGMR